MIYFDLHTSLFIFFQVINLTAFVFMVKYLCFENEIRWIEKASTFKS
jgi:hypothetical protein